MLVLRFCVMYGVCMMHMGYVSPGGEGLLLLLSLGVYVPGLASLSGLLDPRVGACSRGY
jgi:hypothetical protein